MKKVIVVVLCFILLSSTVLLISCSKKTNDGTNNSSNGSTSTITPTTIAATSPTNSPTASAATSPTASATQTFTLDDLKTYDGQNGNPAYVSVSGTVYDVTNAKRWNNGKHVNGIVAGVDLTSALPDSPHGNSVLKDLPVVGTLK